MSIKIDHLAIWTKNLEKSKDFYVSYFDMVCGDKYHNTLKQFSSYFLSCRNSDVRIELMHRPDILEFFDNKGITLGLAHFAISVGSKENVDTLTERLRKDNFKVESEPRLTGDGYYESVVLDIDGNVIEITE